MNELQQQSEPSNDIPQAEILDREAGLHRGLTSWQVAMIGLGSTIGT
jgi:amino acid permease